MGRETWLVLIFRDELYVGLIKGESPRGFWVADTHFKDEGLGDLTAFYDRLVDASGELVGIRLCPVVNQTDYLLRRLPKAPYLQLSETDPCVDVYFSRQPVPNVESTGDQAFGGKLFQSVNGEFAISVDLSYLAESERDFVAISNSETGWVQIELH